MGTGRLFDALVVHGGLRPESLVGIVDANLSRLVSEVHGLEPRRPDELPALAPSTVVVCSREYDAEITAHAGVLCPGVPTVSFAELLAASSTHDSHLTMP